MVVFAGYKAEISQRSFRWNVVMLVVIVLQNMLIASERN